MNAQHTPGPWTVEELAAPKSMPLIAGPRMGDRMPLVATAEFSKTGPIDHDQACANARLIAAAPELLEVLKSLREWDFGAAIYTAEDEKAFAQVVCSAWAVIDKAEGAEGGK